VTGTGFGDSGISISAISRGSLEPAAEARMADTRKADALVAVTCHPYHLANGRHAVAPLPDTAMS